MAQTFDFPITTTDQSVERVLGVGLPTLLVFFDGQETAEMDTAMKQLAKEHAGQLLVVKLHVSDSPATVRRYGIAAAPAVVGLRGNEALTKAERIHAPDISAHGRFLLGRGPKPAPESHGSASARQTTATGVEARPRVVTDASFDRDVLRSAEPVLVDFWAPWCGPCRIVEPVVEALAREYAGRLRVAKVNVDENPSVAGRYGVMSIPTMIVVRDGQQVDRWAGALPESILRNRVAKWMV